MLTEEQVHVLRKNGWKYSNGGFYNCRVCHKPISNWIFGWFSPKMAGYHPACVLRSKQVQKLLGVKK